MEHLFDQNIRDFIRLCANHDVHMILVGGDAVNFHGYQRHSADVDFGIDLYATNLQHVKKLNFAASARIYFFLPLSKIQWPIANT